MSGVFAGLRSSRVTNNDVTRSDRSEAQSLLGGGNKKSKAKKEDGSDNEDSDLAIPLGTSHHVQDQCVEAEVQPGDTLQSLSLKYNVPLAELKRVNNLLTEAEFYALKRIKIPVKTASLLTEILPQVSGDRPNDAGWYIQSHQALATSSSSTVQSSTPVSESETDYDGSVAVSHQLVDLGTSSLAEPPAKSKEAKKANKFLKSIDKDISRIKATSGLQAEAAAEDEEDGYSLTTINGEGQCMTTKLTMPSRRHPYDASWCSKQGLICAFILLLSVMVILGLAYWLNIHESWFEREQLVHNNLTEQINQQAAAGAEKVSDSAEKAAAGAARAADIQTNPKTV